MSQLEQRASLQSAFFLAEIVAIVTAGAIVRQTLRVRFMTFRLCCAVISVALAFGVPAHGEEAAQAREQTVKRQIIEESIASYPGRCPCPYNVTRNGSACGGRSAWSRQGGYAPICYEREITADAVRARIEQTRQSRARANGAPQSD